MLNEVQIQAIIKGTGYTIIIAIVAVIIGTVCGMLVALGRISHNRILNKISWLYVWFFRGTPLLLQLFMIYYAMPLIIKDLTGHPFPINPLMACFVAFGLNSTAYMAEFFRAGIESIDKGQLEASKALGMSYNQAMFKIIIPQSYKRLLPSVGNEFIMLIKDTSLASTVAISDLLRTTKTMSSSSGNWIYYVYAACVYLLMTSIIQFGFDKLEKKVGAYE
ncbi:amino acid ABC transporter permease [Fusibacter ferrireducens]|uniref:Amino acid ABC transporter permease n=1 Tax=Fusibacter ferrireducens TaxID=2785058 RepID=A0ABR9ZU14_9FIRM|nr:amino acid ABC transporter permease [Fusibacter ferrireducens]MBF4693451.1 amino acid ABC transporter permease [Fusibacter ferrireducens]